MNRLEEAGRALVHDPVAEPRDVDDVARAARRRTNRRHAGVSGLALLVVVALLATIVAVRDDDDDRRQVIAGPSDSDALYAHATWHRTYLQQPEGGEGVAAALGLVAYDGTTFVGFAPYDGESLTSSEAWWSTDGKSWSTGRVEVPSSGEGVEINDLVATESGFVAVGAVHEGETLHASFWTSPNGADWHRSGFEPGVQWLEAAAVWNGDVYVAGRRIVGDDALALVGRLDPATGALETASGIPASSVVTSPWTMAATPARIVATHGPANGLGAFVTTDGSRWSDVSESSGLRAELGVVVARGDGFLAFERRTSPDARTGVWAADDGSTWTRVGELDAGGSVRDAVAVPEGFVAIGHVDGIPAVWTSRDGVDWTRIADDSATFAGVENDVVLNTVMWTGGDVVIGGGVAEPSGGFTPTIWATTDELVREPATTVPDATTTTTTTAVHPTPGPVLRPGELAVAAGIGGLRAVDTSTGATRVLDQPSGPTEQVVWDVSVAPDGSLYYTVRNGLSLLPDGVIWRLDTSGPPERVVEVGHAPAISPDGRYLAYATATSPTSPSTDIVVRDLTDGRERRWGPRPDDPDFFRVNGRVITLAWSPDG
ncbi:MAG TPA: hypothetical protein VFZ83_02925, partial [Acidimicrobiia bacterium]|nr:hypothetical protein [Acidimicrobiia bacterium]